MLGSDIPGAEHEQHEAGTALAREALGRYQVLEAPRWQEAPLVSALVPQQREQVREDMGELLLLLAGAVARQTEFDLALRLNDLARGCYPTNSVPRAIWRQRALLASAAGQSDLAQQLSITVEATPVRSPRDRYLLLLTEYQRRGCVLEALPWLTEASRSQNDNFSMWLILGNYYAGLAKRHEARGVLRQSRGFVARVSLAAAVPQVWLTWSWAMIGAPPLPSTKSSGCGPRRCRRITIAPLQSTTWATWWGAGGFDAPAKRSQTAAPRLFIAGKSSGEARGSRRRPPRSRGRFAVGTTR